MAAHTTGQAAYCHRKMLELGFVWILFCLSRKQLVTSSENEIDPLRDSILTFN